MNKIKYIYPLLLLFVSACGYHLRGEINVPANLQSVYLQGASPQLRKALRNALVSSNVSLVDAITQADVVVQVDKEHMDNRVLSLSTTGRANEYELAYSLQYRLLDKSGKSLAKPQTIRINKDYYNNQQTVLAKNNEEQVIRKEIYRQAVRALFTRYHALLGSKQR